MNYNNRILNIYYSINKDFYKSNNNEVYSYFVALKLLNPRSYNLRNIIYKQIYKDELSFTEEITNDPLNNIYLCFDKNMYYQNCSKYDIEFCFKEYKK